MINKTASVLALLKNKSKQYDPSYELIPLRALLRVRLRLWVCIPRAPLMCWATIRVVV